MKNSLQQFVALRSALLREREEITARLEAINAALDQTGPAVPAKTSAALPQAQTKRAPRRNGLPLRAAVVKVTSIQPLSKKEIVTAVEKIGYHFATKNPVNSLNHVLYGDDPKFTVANGKYSPVKAGDAARAPKAIIEVKATPAAAPKPSVSPSKKAKAGKK